MTRSEATIRMLRQFRLAISGSALRSFRGCVVLSVVLLAVSATASQSTGWHETFDEGWQDRWEAQRLASVPTDFLASVYGGESVLRVQATRSAGALIRRVETGAARVSWEWLLDQPLPMDDPAAAEERDRAGDDYAARLFVIFGSDLMDSSTRALCYVWARHESRGAIYPSPVADRIQTVVLRSGAPGGATWRAESVDPAADYRAAFSTEPPPVEAIAIMSDSDDTNASAAVLFDNVRVIPAGETSGSSGHSDESSR